MVQINAKVVRFNKAGDPSVLRLENEIIRPLRENEVLIRVEAIGLNRAEVVFRRGDYFEKPHFPSKIGYEASGVIEQVGTNIRNFAIGDRVSTIPSFSMSSYGVYGEKAVLPAYAVTRYPETLSPAQGASIWMPYLTAYGALVNIAHISHGHTLVVTAASSSVGVAALQLAKSSGARTIALTSSKEKSDFLYGNGADYVVDIYSDNVESLVLKHSGNAGANVVFDPIGGPLLQTLADLAAPGAIIFQYGALDSAPTPYPLHTCVAKGITIRGYTMFELAKNKDSLHKALTQLKRDFTTGTLKPQIDSRRFCLEDIVQAHEYMESNAQRGKIVVNV